LARSAIDGDLDGLRILDFLTEKNAVEARELGAVLGGVAPGARLENFSRALILCEIPDPRLTFLGVGLACCWAMRSRYAAEADTDLGGPD
jgi:hypothetical protein